MKDERTVSVQRQAQSGGFSVLFFGLLAVLVYRSIFLDQNIKEYGDIFIVWLAAGIYTMLSMVLRGVDPAGGQRSQWLPAAAAALAVTGIQIYNNMTYGVGFGVPIAWVAALLTFIIAFVFVMLVQKLFVHLYRRWEKENLD